MTRFLDGPAAGQALLLRRSPLFLRVVRNDKGQWDGLDQVRDMPGLGEAIAVYVRVAVEGHWCRRGGKGSGCFPLAVYRLCEEQPADDLARGIRTWRAWCWAQAAKRKKTNQEP